MAEEEDFEESPSNTAVLEAAEDAANSADDNGQDEMKPLVIDEKADAVEDYLNSPAMAETSYNDPSRKFKCHRCKVAFTRQSYLSVHNRTVAHRRGDKVSFNVEKYLDPSRPYKCEVCKESFTQKNILLVHNNSVSHMRKLKQALQETYPNGDLNVDVLAALSKGNAVVNLAKCSSPSVLPSQSPLPKNAVDLSSSSEGKMVPVAPNSNKRFKCNTCDTYVTESTREIHLRSVKHQSRAAKLPQQSGNGIGGADMDLTQILGDQHSDRSKNSYNAKQLLSEAITKRHHQSIPSTNKHDSSSSSSSAMTAQEAAAAAAASFQSAAALLSMAGFGSFLAAAHAAYQEPGASSARSTILECSHCKKIFPNATQLEIHKEKGCKSLQSEEIKAASSSSAVASSIEQVICNSNRYVRSGRGNIFRRLLEDYGFEVVMQFNEMQPQKKARLMSIEKEATNGEHSEEVATKVSTPAHLTNGNLSSSANGIAPEVKKCVCSQCDATFSSVWVLKAHVEQMHGTVVPLDCVEETSEEFKHAYEKKYLTSVSMNQQEVHSNKTATTSIENKKEVEVATKTQATSVPQQHKTEPNDDQLQQQQQMLAFNAMMQQFSAAAQFPALASNPAAAMGMSQFPFMGMPFSAFGIPNPFLPMMVPPSLDQLAFGANGAPSAGSSTSVAATSVTSSAASTGIGAATTSASSGFVPPAIPVNSTGMHPGVSSMMSQAAQNQQQKRARTRITDDQLKILREYFDINNSPTEEQIEEMSRKSGLPLKVIKHWFRNTLFKERQRCKDSPYNFSIPPSYSIDLEEYEKTGEAKIISLNPNGEPSVASENAGDTKVDRIEKPAGITESSLKSSDAGKVKQEVEITVQRKTEEKEESGRHLHVNGGESAETATEFSRNRQPKEITKPKTENVKPVPKLESLEAVQPFDNSAAEETLRQLSALGALSMQFPNPNPALSSFLTPQHIGTASTTPQVPSNSAPSDTIANLIATAMSPGGQASSGGGRRANRTRFTECQIKTLQEFFEKNAYPKDDDLEYLSQKLALSPRVIVVWFQNARQKARKIYENQPSESDERFHRTPGLNYQCKGCKLVFQRYYELIKHQKTECYREEGGGDASASPTPTSSASTTPKTQSLSHHLRTSSPMMEKGENEYRCVQCNITFTGTTQFSEHMKVHASNPMLFMGEERSESAMSLDSRKRGYAALGDCGSENMSGGDGMDSLSDDQDSGSTKRQRTQILPEQLDTLYKKYNKDANPSSRNLEKIAQETGLNKRVVQVWFQNTRARERRGQLNDRQFFNKRCPFCGILYHSKQTMEAHMNSRHAAQLGTTKVDIDSLPDAEEVPTITTVPVPESILAAARSGGNGNELAQSMLSFGMVPGTTTVPGPARSGKGQDGNTSATPLDLSRTIRGSGFDCNRPSSVDRGCGSGTDGGIPRTPSTGNSNEEAMSMDDYDDSRSAFDHDSPSPHQQVLAALARPQKRFRTHLTSQQVKVMKHLFQDYKTPTMAECETLGQEIGLHKRVVQVWFQNARAKERKAKQSGDSSYGNSSSPSGDSMKPLPTRCELCSVAYNTRTTMQDHLFCRNHLEKVKALAESEDDGLHVSSPKFIGEQRPVLDDSSRPASKMTPSSSASSMHQSRSQQKQQQPQKRQPSQQPSQEPSPSPASSVAQNFLPYMYAAGGLPQAYYANLASSMMYSGAFPGMYDLNLHGTPVNMLQIPAAVMKLITTAMARPRDTSCRFTQDGMTVADLSKSLSNRDRSSLVGTDLEVGWACRRCTTVFQTEALFSNHQRMICQSKDPAFKLVQTHYECRFCTNGRFGTQEGFKQHCQTPEHIAKIGDN